MENTEVPTISTYHSLVGVEDTYLMFLEIWVVQGMSENVSITN